MSTSLKPVRCLLGSWIASLLFSASAFAADFPSISLTSVANGFTLPVHVNHAGDGSGRLFVVEKPGRIKIVNNGVVTGTFLDISSKVRSVSEQGLLSIAFPPDYAAKNYFYVYYNINNTDGSTTVSRFHVTEGNPDFADPASEEVIFTTPQEFSNHNGGMIGFSPVDGYLYLGLGDGGSANDPNNRGQDPDSFLGKMLRFDVESVVTNGYQVPASNPFVSDSNFLDEIWAWGLRNPWRFSFDRANGDLFIADVGQGAFEEIDYQPAASPGGENYGWKIMEGFECRGGGSACSTNLFEGKILPIHAYPRAEGQSITGGHLHRGSPAWSYLHGCYLYADYKSGRIWALKRDGGNWVNQLLLNIGGNNSYSSFGEDEAGNVYVAHYSGGTVYRIDDATIYPDSDNDQLPDAWESFYGLNTNDVLTPNLDGDNDGLSNAEEFIAGTDPTNTLSRFFLTLEEVSASNQAVISWPSVKDKVYDLEFGTDLTDPVPFGNIISNHPAAPPTNVLFHAITSGLERTFYRLRVRPAE